MGVLRGALTRARVPFTWVSVCPGTDAQVTFVRVRTDVQVAICQRPVVRGKPPICKAVIYQCCGGFLQLIGFVNEICQGKESIVVFHCAWLG